jgi:hypothetical protein
MFRCLNYWVQASTLGWYNYYVFGACKKVLWSSNKVVHALIPILFDKV